MTQNTSEITLFWFRRDLRLSDNAGLYQALKNNKNVLPLFIFDQNILKLLPKNDLRVQFIHKVLTKIQIELKLKNTDLLCEYGTPVDIFKKLSEKYKIKEVYANHDYEPNAIERDLKVKKLLEKKGIDFKTFKDQTIFEKNEIQTDMGKPYTVYTPYKKKWLASLSPYYLKAYPVDLYEGHYLNTKTRTQSEFVMPTLKDMGFEKNDFIYPEELVSQKVLKKYAETRDYPFLDQGTSRLGLHLRFGTVSVRELAKEAKKHSDVWLSELIWRDFFMQILWNFPHVEKASFRPQYEKIKWRNEPEEINRWKTGQTGYPLVDAGMRELNATGHMHNRVRMVVASFLTKHLLHHWLVGERYFAEKLLDYDLSANNGNWQWSAGTGCDAAPYFRVFNPEAQIEKFDPDYIYTKKWVPEFQTTKYIKPIVEHTFARQRALTEFKKGLES